MMTAEKSVLAFGAYLVITGAGLLLMPALLLAPLGLPAPQEVWIRVLGLVVLALAAYYLQAARHRLEAFIASTVPVRIAVAAGFLGGVLLAGWPPMLLLFGGVDLLGALWTRHLLAPARAPNP